jgi:hypothetical protein
VAVAVSPVKKTKQIVVKVCTEEEQNKTSLNETKGRAAVDVKAPDNLIANCHVLEEGDLVVSCLGGDFYFYLVSFDLFIFGKSMMCC